MLAREQRPAHLRRVRQVHGHAQQRVVQAVEHQGARALAAGAAQRVGHGQPKGGQVLDGVQAVLARAIGVQVGDQRHIGLRQRQAAVQQFVAVRLQHRGRHGRVAQHGARTVRAGPEPLATHDRAPGATEAGREAGGLGDGGEQPRRRRPAPAARDQQLGHGAQRVPGHVQRQRQRGTGPDAGVPAFAEPDAVVVGQQRHAVPGGGLGEALQRQRAFGRGAGAEVLARVVLRGVGGLEALGGVHGVSGGGTLPGPLVERDGGLQRISRRGEHQQLAPGVQVHARIRPGPAERGAGAHHARDPAPLGRAVGRRRALRHQCHGGAGVPAVGPDEPARVGKGTPRRAVG